MSYISKQFDDMLLPDGTVACCVRDIDAYLRRSGLTMASDYSKETIKAIKDNRNKAVRQDLFASFINTYKRKIWNETKSKNNKRNY